MVRRKIGCHWRENDASVIQMMVCLFHHYLLTHYKTAAVADKKRADAKSHGTATPGAAS